jgi:hypothetical protein
LLKASYCNACVGQKNKLLKSFFSIIALFSHSILFGQIEKNWYVKNDKIYFGTISETIGFLANPRISNWDKLTFFNSDKEPIRFNQADYYIKPDYDIFQPLKVSGERDRFFVTTLRDQLVLFDKRDTTLTFQTWEDHIVHSVSSLGFNPKSNPIRKESSGMAAIVPYIHDSFYHPIKIKGEWLLLRKFDEEYGWIKWRDGDHLLIDIFYLL